MRFCNKVPSGCDQSVQVWDKCLRNVYFKAQGNNGSRFDEKVASESKVHFDTFKGTTLSN